MPVRHRVASCLLLPYHAHTHTVPCPCLSLGHMVHLLGSGPKPALLPLPHLEQRETSEGPAGHVHDLLSLQGQPKSLTISSDPGRGWRR